MRHFGITAGGNFEHGRHGARGGGSRVAQLARGARRPEDEVERELAAARQTLFEAREKRVKPGRDDKMLAGWNGLMIRGLAFASRVFERPEWAQLRGAAPRTSCSRSCGTGRGCSASYQEGQATHRRLPRGLRRPRRGADRALPGHLRAAVPRGGGARWCSRRGGAASGTRRSRRTSPRRGAEGSGGGDLRAPRQRVPVGRVDADRGSGGARGAHGRQAHLELPERYVARMRERAECRTHGLRHLGLAADALLDGAASVTIAGASETWRRCGPPCTAPSCPRWRWRGRHRGSPCLRCCRGLSRGVSR